VSDAVQWSASPTVSVVIPTYNRLPLLCDAVESVRAQTFGDWELIVADDGSTDDTPAYLTALQRADERVRVLYMEHSATATRARAEGTALARGEWLAFLDSDDVWLPRKLEVQLRAMAEHPECAWSYTSYQHTPDPRSTTDRTSRGVPAPVSGWILEPLVTYAAAAAIPTILVRRSHFWTIGGFDRSLRLRSDYDLALRLAASSPAHGVGEVLVLVREHAGRTTNSYPVPAQLQENVAVFRKALAFAPNARVRRCCAAQLGAQYAHMARLLDAEKRHLDALGALAHCVRSAPLSLRTWRAVAAHAARATGLHH
jgi:glycosyltransferase involved in cell wall biosynthesis